MFGKRNDGNKMKGGLGHIGSYENKLEMALNRNEFYFKNILKKPFKQVP